MTAKELLIADEERLDRLVTEYPERIPVKVVAEILNCNADTVRSLCEQNHVFGDGYKKIGATRGAVLIPTATFVRWYTKGIFVK